MSENDVNHDILTQLRRIANALEKMSGVKPTGPDYRRTLAEYPTFDWSSIGAEVVGRDDDGPTVVFCDGFQWSRRSPQNKFGEAIWFSRSDGKDAEGETVYLRLITFKQPAEVDPLNRKVRQELETRTPAQQPAKPAPVQPAKPAPAQPQQYATQTIKHDEPKAITYKKYIEMATAPRFNLVESGAIFIAQQFGVEDPGEDYTLPAKWLPFFAEAKTAGLKLASAIQIMESHNRDYEKSIQSVRIQASALAPSR